MTEREAMVLVEMTKLPQSIKDKCTGNEYVAMKQAMLNVMEQQASVCADRVKACIEFTHDGRLEWKIDSESIINAGLERLV